MRKRLLILGMCLTVFLLSACSAQQTEISEVSQSAEITEQNTEGETPESPSFDENAESSAESFTAEENNTTKSVQKPVVSQESEEPPASNQTSQSQTSQSQSSGGKPEIPSDITEPVTERPTQPVTERPIETTKPEPETTKPPVKPFDVSGYIRAAKSYGQSIGLKLDSTATACWDNPIYASADSRYIRRDLEDALNWYKDSGFTAFWIWSENLGNNDFNIYIGYA